jgi:hypothetical protein
VRSISDLLRAIPALTPSALLSIAAASGGVAFAFAISTTTRFSNRMAAGLGGPAVAAIVYSSFIARMMATGVFFAFLVTVSPAAALAAAGGFVVVLLAIPTVDLVRFARPRMRRGG